MVGYEFWNRWKRKSKLEELAIHSIKAARKIVLNEIPRGQIIAIYVKGSFIRREMNEKSDVDMLVILKEIRFFKKLKKLEEKFQNKSPPIRFSGYSLWELKNNKKVKSVKRSKASPSRTIQHLEHYQLIHGKKLKAEDFFQEKPEKHLRGMLVAFRKIFLPKHKRGEFGFSELIKQVFWLVENEQRCRGKSPPHSWKKLAKSIEDKNHIIHDALMFRLKPTKDKTKRKKFLKKLEKYLLKVEKSFYAGSCSKAMI